MTKSGNGGEGVGRVLWPFLLNSPEFLSWNDWKLVLKLNLQSKFTFTLEWVIRAAAMVSNGGKHVLL